MKVKELKKKYLEFFQKKNHQVIRSASLVPEHDPTVLFTTAGMHPLVPFLMGQPHPLGKRLVNIQKCIRTVDIDEVGDKTHHTFFEMLGNWSLGDYFKKEAIEMTFEFHTKVLKIPIEKYAVSCFKGDKDAPKDNESAKVWETLGVPKKRIAFLGKEENWWGPAGVTGPCGPCTEMFYWASEEPPPEAFNVEDKRWVEIGNDVILEYDKTADGKYIPLKQKNIDFGGGVERTIVALNGLDDSYMSELFLPIIKKIESITNKEYKDNKRLMRIVADHIKASVFILADGVAPSNLDQGYILRRFIRRSIRNLKTLGIPIKNIDLTPLAKEVIHMYKEYYDFDDKFIFDELKKEQEQFKQTLEKGLKEFEKLSTKDISGKDAFLLFQSYGFPLEIVQELAHEKGIKVDEKAFHQEFRHHQELSRVGAEKRFKGGLADSSEETKRLHTATHLLNEALRVVLKDKKVVQKGSNITPERLRFDFNFDRRLTEEEIRKIEDLVNKHIKEAIPIKKEEMTLDEAKKRNAQGVFEHKYADKVSVYSIGNFSIEICGGPHVNNTKELGTFKIIKEESSAAGIRRIKAVLR